MTIDEAITFCNEKLKELRELKDTITSNAEVLERQGYNKAIDDFMEKIDDDICNDCSKCGNGCRLLELRQIAEQLKAGERDEF